jgi:hypothetical protein
MQRRFPIGQARGAAKITAGGFGEREGAAGIANMQARRGAASEHPGAADCPHHDIFHIL